MRLILDLFLGIMDFMRNYGEVSEVLDTWDSLRYSLLVAKLILEPLEPLVQIPIDLA